MNLPEVQGWDLRDGKYENPERTQYVTIDQVSTWGGDGYQLVLWERSEPYSGDVRRLTSMFCYTLGGIPPILSMWE